MAYQIIVLSKDKYWLKAVAEVANGTFSVAESYCTDDVSECVTRLPASDPEALLLVDTALPGKVEAGVQRARELGWQYIVPVAAAPYEREARAVLRAGAYDYWTKSYHRAAIRKQMDDWATDLEGER